MTQRRSVNWSRVLVYGLLPALALLLAIAAGLLKWKDSSIRDIDIARSESVSTARDSAQTGKPLRRSFRRRLDWRA